MSLHNLQDKLERADLGSSGQILNNTFVGHLAGWGSTVGNGLQNWAPGARFLDTDDGSTWINDGTKTAAVWRAEPWHPDATKQTLAAGGGAVTLTEFYTAGASDAGGDAWTLANSARAGQLKKIQLVTDGGGDATLTPTTFADGTTITFADAGDYVVLKWKGSAGWTVIEAGNDADGATAPVVA
jgi:hypothetical protein